MALPDPARRAAACVAAALIPAACGADAPPAPPPPTCLAWVGPPVVLAPPGLDGVEQPKVARAGDTLVLAWREARSRALVLASVDDRLAGLAEPRELLPGIATGPSLDGDGAVVTWTIGSTPRASWRRVDPSLSLIDPPMELSLADLPPATSVDGAVDGEAIRLVTAHPDDAERLWMAWDPGAAPPHRALTAAGVTRSGPAVIDVAGERVRILAAASADPTWRLLVLDPAAETPAQVDLATLPAAPDALDASLADALYAAWGVGGAVHVARITDDGTVTTEDLGSGRAPAVHALGGRAVVAWADGDAIRARVLAPACATTAATLDPDAVGAPDVVLWGDGEGAVVWEGTTRGAHVAWGRRFRLDGAAPARTAAAP